MMEAATFNRSAASNANGLLNAYFQIVRLHLTAEERLVALEDALSAKMPAAYASFLSNYRADMHKNFIVGTNTGYWEVSTLFEFAEGPIDLQLDSVYSVVCDTLPPALLPIAKNSVGNFYCLVVDGEKKGQVVFLNKKQTNARQYIEDVAPSFSAFLLGLRH